MTFSQKLEDALERLLVRSRELGIRPETTIYYAIGNPRALETMRRKAASLDANIDRINSYLDKPPER